MFFYCLRVCFAVFSCSVRKINLQRPSLGDIKWEATKFPDGQQNVTISDEDVPSEVQLSSRICGWRDLELVLCATASLREAGARRIHLFASYFCGARSDRKFVEGGNNYLKDVICPVVNGAGFASVEVLDPHSDVLEACLAGFKKRSNHSLVSKAVSELGDSLTLVAPDAGAVKKTWDVARKFGISNIVVADKVREVSTGKILRTEVPGVAFGEEDKTFLILDDICDGGRTFIALGEEIRRKRGAGAGKTIINLVVTHGIFSAGLSPFKGVIDKIYTTNSYQDIPGCGEWARENEEFLDMVSVEEVI